MALHSRDAVTVCAAVATRSRADCTIMEDRRCKSIILVWPTCRTTAVGGLIVCV